MYWYNKVKKLRIEMPGSEKLKEVEVAFKAFKSENLERKNEVKSGKITEMEYTNWLFAQQDKINQIMYGD